MEEEAVEETAEEAVEEEGSVERAGKMSVEENEEEENVDGKTTDEQIYGYQLLHQVHMYSLLLSKANAPENGTSPPDNQVQCNSFMA